MFADLAYAMSGAPAEGGQGGMGSLASLAPLIIMFVIFYFLLIRPQQKKAKDHRSMLGNLQKGDRIVTSGGLIGEITGLNEREITLEIAPKIRVKVSRGHISGLAGTRQGQAPAPAEKTK